MYKVQTHTFNWTLLKLYICIYRAQRSNSQMEKKVFDVIIQVWKTDVQYEERHRAVKMYHENIVARYVVCICRYMFAIISIFIYTIPTYVYHILLIKPLLRDLPELYWMIETWFSTWVISSLSFFMHTGGYTGRDM